MRSPHEDTASQKRGDTSPCLPSTPDRPPPRPTLTQPCGTPPTARRSLPPRSGQVAAPQPRDGATHRCRSCRRRPAGGWGRKCTPPPPGPAGSSCTGTRRGSRATPSCCPRGALRAAAAVLFARPEPRLLAARSSLPRCLLTPPLSRPRVAQPSLGGTERARVSSTAQLSGAEASRAVPRCPVRRVIASIAPSRAPGAPPQPTNRSPALPHRRERPAGRGGAVGRGFSALYGIERGAPRAGGSRVGGAGRGPGGKVPLRGSALSP